VSARDAAGKPLSEHLEDYRAYLRSKGGGAKHANQAHGAITRLLKSAGIGSIADMQPVAIQTAIGLMPRSARTKNYALGAVRAFARWAVADRRIEVDPLASLKSRFNEQADVRRKRRDLTREEMGRLIEAANDAPVWPTHKSRRAKTGPRISGYDRGTAYLIAAGTGFRASEIRSLTPESFNLGDAPAVTVSAGYTKNGKPAVQPITTALADRLRVRLEAKLPDKGQPVLDLPEKTAKMLRFDLAAAGIPYETAEGVVDFHSLRGVYVTRLVESGASIKEVQELARHSTPTLTIQRYTRTDDRRKRKALEGLE
jgi:integrase